MLQVVRVLEADEDVANCCCPHPSLPVLATSGIETCVKLWSPLARSTACNSAQTLRLVARNQDRMREAPAMRSINLPPRLIQALTENPDLLNMLMHRARAPEEAPNPADDDPTPPELTCRVN